MIYLWAFLLICAVLICWVLTFVGIPGNWLMAGSTAIYALLVPHDLSLGIGWWMVLLLLLLAGLGEALEMLAGMLGAARAGGSKRAALLALGGSLIGGVVGLFIGVPIPVIGSLVAAVLGAGLGAMIGAVLGEEWKGRSMGQSLRVGHAAFWGRLLGTLAKSMIGAVMVAAVLAALVL